MENFFNSDAVKVNDEKDGDSRTIQQEHEIPNVEAIDHPVGQEHVVPHSTSTTTSRHDTEEIELEDEKELDAMCKDLKVFMKNLATRSNKQCRSVMFILIQWPQDSQHLPVRDELAENETIVVRSPVKSCYNASMGTSEYLARRRRLIYGNYPGSEVDENNTVTSSNDAVSHGTANEANEAPCVGCSELDIDDNIAQFRRQGFEDEASISQARRWEHLKYYSKNWL